MGKYVIFAEFGGDEEYTARRSRPLFLEGVNPHLKLTINTINTLTYNQINTVTGTIKTQANANVPNYNVKLVVTSPNGIETEITSTSNSSGVFSIDFTPTLRGEYILYVKTDSDDNYSSSMSEQLTVLTDSLTTTTTLTSNVESAIAGHEITLTAKVKDSTNNVVKGLTVQFYDGNTSLGSVTTNTNGEAVLNLNLNTVKTYSFKAVSVANTMYTASTSSIVTVTSIKHTLTATLNANTIYVGWTAKIRIVDEDNEPVSNTSFTVVVGGSNQTLITDSGGTLTTNVFNTVGTTTLQVKRSATTDCNALDTSFSLKVNGLLDIDSSPTSVSNTQTKIPYKIWENLGNTVIANDGNYCVCGTNCYRNMLGGKNGSWNTPAPLKFGNLGLDIPDNADLDSLEIYMSIRTLSCSSDSAKIGIPAPTVSMFNHNVLMNVHTSDARLPYKNFGTIDATIDLTNISVSQLNNSSTYFVVTFPKNVTTNPGKLQIDHVYVRAKYTPGQEG